MCFYLHHVLFLVKLYPGIFSLKQYVGCHSYEEMALQFTNLQPLFSCTCEHEHSSE